MASELFSLKGLTALVTGCTRGIGKSMAIGLAEAGADIVLVQRNETKGETYQTIEKLGRKVSIIVADLSDSKQVSNIYKEVEARKLEIRILLNCAGVQRRSPAAEFPDEYWDEVIQVNLKTVFILCRDIGGKHMLKHEPIAALGGHKGKVINLASLNSFQGGILIPAYAASKGGIATLTKELSNEWASKGVNVNAIVPGYIATEMTEAIRKDPVRSKDTIARIPAGRWGVPDDFKGPVVFLASKASNYLDGELLTVDGGWMGR